MGKEPSEELQETAKEIVDKGLADKAAEACGVTKETIRGWADGSIASDMPEDDAASMEDVLINNSDS